MEEQSTYSQASNLLYIFPLTLTNIVLIYSMKYSAMSSSPPTPLTSSPISTPSSSTNTTPSSSASSSPTYHDVEIFQSNVEMLKGILGDDISFDRIRHALRGADGRVDVALNHLLNDREYERAGSDSPTSTTNLTPLEKVLCDLAEEVKCPMCLGYFRQPLILTCFHTFCNECLEELVSNDQISCPLCRTIVTLPERGLAGLRPNHYLANIVDKLKSSQSTKMCAECQRAICTVYCKQCKGFLCDDCNDSIHSIRVLNTHHRTPFDEMFLSSSSRIMNQIQFYDLSYDSDCVIPFNVKKEVCQDLFLFWIKDLWFAPSDLNRRAMLGEVKTLYIPYWLFEVESTSSYNCLVGYSDRLNDVTQSRNLSLWTPTSGAATGKFADIAVCASDAPEVNELAKFEPWKFDQIQPFTLKHVEGVEVLPFSMESDKAWSSVAKLKAEQMNRELCEKALRTNSRSATVSNMVIDSSFVIKKSRRLFVPVYSSTYEYRGITYHVLINGSTAKVLGTRPYSTSKLASLSVTGIGAAIGIITSRLNS